jgi:hypothetical protein
MCYSFVVVVVVVGGGIESMATVVLYFRLMR